MTAKVNAHHQGDYPRRARAVRAQAYANPDTRCWRCGRTLAEHQRAWQAGHVDDGVVGGALLAECAECNTSNGATVGNRRRIGLVPSRDW